MDAPELKDPKPLTIADAAAYLGLSISYLYRLTSERRIPHYKSAGGKRVYFKREDLDAWAYGNHVKTSDDIEQEAATRVVLGS